MMARSPAKRSIRLLAGVAGIGLVLAACAGSAAVGSSGNAAFNGAQSQQYAGGARQGALEAAASAAPAAAVPPDHSGTGGTAKASGAAIDPNAALIVKNGTLSVQVRDLDAALTSAQAAITALGGYVSDSQRTNEGDRSSAHVTYRIPAASWDAALTALHRVASKVVSEQTTAVEVTGQVLDLGARITNLQATERALQAIMARATKITDVLDVQQQLTDVRGQIEQLQTEKAHLEKEAALGTLAVSFALPVTPISAVTTGWDPGSDVDRAVAQLVSIGQGLVTSGVWFVVVWLPVLIGLGIVTLVVLLVARALRRSGRLPRIRRGAPPSGTPGVSTGSMAPLG